MRLKRLAPGTIFLVFGLAGLPDTAFAQLSGGQWRLPQGSGGTGTTAVEAKPQPQVVIQPGRHSGQRTVFPRYPVAYTLVPAIILSDGTIVANFGYGYEPVYRSCSGAVVVGQPAVVGSNGVVLRQPQPVTYTQPVPNQQTASQQLLSSNRAGAAVSSGPAQASCYSRDPYGRVLVYRY